ncbi:hypothetical protein Gpo141_00000675 [Globisporangium polare]
MPPRGRKRKSADNSEWDEPEYAAAARRLSGGGLGDEADLSAAVSSLSTAFPFASGGESRPATATTTSTGGAFVKRSQLSAREKLTVIEWYHANGKNQQATSAHFKSLPGYEKLSQSTVSRWIAGEEKIRELVDSGRANVVRVNPVRHPDFENVLKAWLDRMDGSDVTHLTGDLIKQTAVKVYEHLQIPAEQRLELSNGWLRSFQIRQGIKVGKPRRTATSGLPSSDYDHELHTATGSLPGTPPTTTAPSQPHQQQQQQQPWRVDSSATTDDEQLQPASVNETPHMPTTATTTTPSAQVSSRRMSSSLQVPRRPTPSSQQTSRPADPLAVATFRRIAITVPDAVIKREQERIANSIREFLSWDHKRSISDVWNFDEVPLCYALSPDASDLAAAASPEAAERVRKQSFTLALAVNADGSERRAPLIIGKTERPISFKKGRTGPQLGFQYLHNHGAWMTAEIFFAWLNLWNNELLAQDRHVLLLVDSFSGHKLGKKEFSNIQLEYFGARVTEIVQPFCDVVGGIARAFKACFRQLFVLRAADRLISDTAAVEQESIFAIDQLAAMELAMRAWPLVQSETIRRCWRNAKILPMDQSSNRSDVRPGILVLPELQALQDSIFFLREEARVKGTWVDLMDASTFVEVDVGDIAGHDARLEEIVQFTVGGRERSTGGRGADGNPVTGVLNEADGTTAADGSATNSGAITATSGPADSDVGSTELAPVQVYKSLLVLEQYWRENAMLVSNEVRGLLESTRKHLQADVNEARQPHQAPLGGQQTNQRSKFRRK